MGAALPAWPPGLWADLGCPRNGVSLGWDDKKASCQQILKWAEAASFFWIPASRGSRNSPGAQGSSQEPSAYPGTVEAATPTRVRACVKE